MTHPRPGAAPHRLTGRHTKLTPDTANTIIDAVAAGNYLDTAARAAGVHPATVYRWLENADKPGTRYQPHREFRDALDRARGTAEQTIVGSVVEAVKGGTVTKRVTRMLRDGTEEVEETITAPDGRVGLEFLSRAFPDRWARRAALEVTGAAGGPIQISAERLSGLADRVGAALAAAADVVDAEVVNDPAAAT